MGFDSLRLPDITGESGSILRFFWDADTALCLREILVANRANLMVAKRRIWEEDCIPYIITQTKQYMDTSLSCECLKHVCNSQIYKSKGTRIRERFEQVWQIENQSPELKSGNKFTVTHPRSGELSQDFHELIPADWKLNQNLNLIYLVKTCLICKKKLKKYFFNKIYFFHT